MLGSLLAFRLVGRGRLAFWFGVGVALFGAPLVVVGVVPEQATAIVLLGLVGIGNALIDVGGFTLLARLADETVLARMFAGFEAILTLGVAAGGLVAPLIIDLLGVRPALVVVGLLAPLAVAAGWPALRRLDAGCTCATRTSTILRRSACWACSRGDDRAAGRRAGARRPRARANGVPAGGAAVNTSTSSSRARPRCSSTGASSGPSAR